MPEGPEIRRAADKVEGAVKGQTVRVSLTLPRIAEWEEALTGQRVLSVDTHGKLMLTRFSGDMTVASHNQLYGRWTVCKRENIPKTGRQLRFGMYGDEKAALLYSASDIQVFPTGDVEEFERRKHLGPDPLRDEAGAFYEQLQAKTFSGRALGGLLLDQRFAAGLGNYLRSEILFFAGLTPQTRPKDLDKRQQKKLAKLVVEITQRSYQSNGITVPPSWVAKAKKEGEPKRQHRFAVFARAGKPCRACAGVIEKTEVGGRRLYLCPACQR